MASQTMSVRSKVKAASLISGCDVIVTATDSPGAPEAVFPKAGDLVQEGRHNLLNHLSQHAERRLHDEVDESCRGPTSVCANPKTKKLYFSDLSRLTTS